MDMYIYDVNMQLWHWDNMKRRMKERNVNPTATWASDEQVERDGNMGGERSMVLTS